MQISDTDLDRLSRSLEFENRVLGTSAVVAPAVPYETSRTDLVDINARLFLAAKRAGDHLGIPTYATVVVGLSATTPDVIADLMSNPTTLSPDGWYLQFEFSEGRLPNTADEVFRFFIAGLILAGTDQPVLHVSAGPMCLLSFASGAAGAAVSCQQSLWGFERTKWEAPPEGGGGGKAPARFFSSSLWGTIVQPDEVILLPESLRARVLTHTVHSSEVAANPTTRWQKRAANKHMIRLIADATSQLASLHSARSAADYAAANLNSAIELHNEIAHANIPLRDNIAGYQRSWHSAVIRSLSDRSDDYAWLDTLGR